MPDIWMDVDTALSEVPVNIAALIDDTDFKTREESVTYDQAGMDLVWNFVTTAGAMTQTAVTPTTAGVYDWTNQGNGMYSIEIPASGGVSINNDTEGMGWFTGFATGILPWRGPVIGFRAAGLNNVLIDSAYSATRGLAGTALPDAAADAAGGLPISDAGGLDLDGVLSGNVPQGADNNTILSSLTIADGAVDAKITYIMDTILTEGGAGRLAAAFIKLFDVATPLLVASDVMRGTDGANTTTPPTAVQNRQEMDSNSTQLAAIVTDTGTTLDDHLTDIKGSGFVKDTHSLPQCLTGSGGDATEAKQDTILAKMLAYFRLALRSDAGPTTDDATELTAINADSGAGGGDYAAGDAQEGIRDKVDTLSPGAATEIEVNVENIKVSDS